MLGGQRSKGISGGDMHGEAGLQYHSDKAAQ